MASPYSCKRYGVSGLYVVAVTVVTVFLLTLPYTLHHQGSSTQIASALSQLRSIHATEASIRGNHESPLAQILAAASMASPFPNNTVILTFLNAAWSSPPPAMLDLVLSSFRLGEGTAPLLRHLVIVCVDHMAFERCVEVHDHCLRMSSTTTKAPADFEGEKLFMSGGFVDMMWRRVQFLGEVLQLGYSFIFSDGDILWFRNPLSVFSQTVDFQISTDRFRHRPFDLRNNLPNTGFFYARSSNRTAALYRRWSEEGRRSPGMNDQQVLTALFNQQRAWVREVGVTVQFFDTVYFSGFCEVSGDMSKVVTMHSNCCVGLSTKLHDLRLALEDWRAYRSNATAYHNDATAYRSNATADPLQHGNGLGKSCGMSLLSVTFIFKVQHVGAGAYNKRGLNGKPCVKMWEQVLATNMV